MVTPNDQVTTPAARPWSTGGGRAGATQPTAERPGMDSVRVQPTAKQFAPPNQPDVSASDKSEVEKLYPNPSVRPR